MSKESTAIELKKAADENGVISILSVFLPWLHVKIPMSQALWDTSIDELPLSVRSKNGLLRTGAKIIGDIVNLIMNEKGLEGVRNLGKKSVCEIKTSIIEIAYGKLTENEKTEFWSYIIASNSSN